MPRPAPHLEVCIAEQTLLWHAADGSSKRWLVSTASNGVGQANGSGATPLGKHVVRAKIGAGQPVNAVFVGRRPTGEVYSPSLAAEYPTRDWILTRILWLSGCEPGFNRLGSVDTMRRFIYIHGCPDHCPMGVPESHGCIRMRNADVLELFSLTPVGAVVEIHQ
jgi:lipoprotein-anchoring transpeptidase ErfK/SrfK